MAHGITEFCRNGLSTINNRTPSSAPVASSPKIVRAKPKPLVATDPSIAAAVAESFPDFDREERRAGTLLIGALGCGTSYAKLRQYTGVPWHSVTNAGYYLRRAGIWQGQLINYPWLEPFMDGDPLGEVGFTLDVLVGVGMVNRLMIDGEAKYQAAEMLGGGITRFEFFKLHPRRHQRQRLG